MPNRETISVVKRRAFLNTLELRLRRSKGTAFQEFFAAVMTKVHGDNFVPASAAYSHGDIACDGLLNDPLTVYACYGPVDAGSGQKQSTIAQAVSKVGSDLAGAIKNWPDMKGWVFVTNYVEGTPPQISKEILKLNAADPNRHIRQFGKSDFENAILSLPVDEIEILLGYDATDADFRGLQLSLVQDVVDEIIRRSDYDAVPSDEVPLEISPKKLSGNNLPPVYKKKLVQGFVNAGDVADYLLNHPDPTLDSRVATVFKNHYLNLSSSDLTPGQIMDNIFNFALGENKPTASLDVAIWSLLAYLFERCTIFKDVAEETTS